MSEDITKIKVDYASMSQKLDNLYQKVDNMDKKIDGMDKKYAGKWIEIVAVGALIGILAQIIMNGV